MRSAGRRRNKLVSAGWTCVPRGWWVRYKELIISVYDASINTVRKKRKK